MPKQGPSEGSRRQLMAFLPMRLRPSPRPTVVVVLPSPAGVGLIAVTRISLPSGLPFIDSTKSMEILALVWPKGRNCSSGIPSFAATSRIGFSLASRAISISLPTFLDTDADSLNYESLVQAGPYSAGYSARNGPGPKVRRAYGFRGAAECLRATDSCRIFSAPIPLDEK